MSEVTQILSALGSGDPVGADRLLQLVYGELRRLAARCLAGERPGQTLQATALVHEAWMKLVDTDARQDWRSRAHFFGAAAEAMRRILIDRARRKLRPKHGGGRRRLDLDTASPATTATPDALLAVDEALLRLEARHPDQAMIVKLRHYAGCSLLQAAEVMGVSAATAKRHWAFARAHIFGDLMGESE